MQYKECPHCGAHLDHGEQCDCKGKKEDAPDAPGTPSKDSGIATSTSLSKRAPDVNDCLQLREIMHQTGAMGKDVAMVVRDTFPSFNRQLLAQCQAPEKYGIIIHPDGLQVICDAYGISLAPAPASVAEDAPSDEVITVSGPRKRPNRKLARKLTFRMRDEDYELLERRVREGGFHSSQAWLYHVVMMALREGKT